MTDENAATGERPRAVLDTSVLLSQDRHWLWLLAHEGVYEAVWSTFIVAEVTRSRFRMTLERCIKLASIQECLHNKEYRRRINQLIHSLSDVLEIANYRLIETSDNLPDPDDNPVLATALAAQADYVVSLNTKDFLPGKTLIGMRYVTPAEFLDLLDSLSPEAGLRQIADDPGRRLP